MFYLQMYVMNAFNVEMTELTKMYLFTAFLDFFDSALQWIDAGRRVAGFNEEIRCNL